MQHDLVTSNILHAYEQQRENYHYHRPHIFPKHRHEVLRRHVPRHLQQTLQQTLQHTLKHAVTHKHRHELLRRHAPPNPHCLQQRMRHIAT